MRWLLALCILEACHRETAPVGRCAPANKPATFHVTHSKVPFVADGQYILGLLRDLRGDVRLREGNELLVQDAMAGMCAPCVIPAGIAVEDMYPMDALDQAADARCMGLLLRDGSFAPGKAFGLLEPRDGAAAKPRIGE